MKMKGEKKVLHNAVKYTKKKKKLNYTLKKMDFMICEFYLNKAVKEPSE